MKFLALDLKAEFYSAAQAVVLSVFDGLARTQYCGTQHIPIKGACLFASNHLSHLDPPLVGCLVPRPICYFARDTLLRPGFVEWLLSALHAIPIKRDSDSDVGGLKRTLKALQSGESLLLFPEGTRSQTGQMGTAKAGVGLIACRTQVPVVPIRIFGTHKLAFGKAHLWDWQATLQVHFGPALPASKYDPGNKDPNRYQTASDRILEAICKLPAVRAPVI